jgi:hypothetical protein
MCFVVLVAAVAWSAAAQTAHAISVEAASAASAIAGVNHVKGKATPTITKTAAVRASKPVFARRHQIYGNVWPHNYRNLALNRTCDQSSTPDGRDCHNAINNDSSTYAMTITEEAPWLAIDLREQSYVHKLEFVPVVGHEDGLCNFTITLYNQSNFEDGNASASSSSSSSPFVKRVQLPAGAFSTKLAFHISRTAQFVRITRASPGVLAIRELRIFGSTVNSDDNMNRRGDEFRAYKKLPCGGWGTLAEKEDGSVCRCLVPFSGRECEYTSSLLMFFGVFMLSCWCVSLQCATALASQNSNSLDTNTNNVKSRGKYTQLPTSNGAAVAKRKQNNNNNIAMVRLPPSILSAPPLHTYKSTSTILSRGIDRAQAQTQQYRLQQAPPLDVATSESVEDCAARLSLAVMFASPLVYYDTVEKRPKPLDALDVDREFRLLEHSIQQSGRKIRLHAEVATVDNFKSLVTLGRYRALHFSGHCHPEYIAFEDPTGAAHFVTPKSLLRLFSAGEHGDSHGIRLIFLNSCHSSNIARQLVACGVPHVVCTHTAVRDASSAAFTRAFYLGLACGKDIASCFEAAQEAVRACPDLPDSEAAKFLLLPGPENNGNGHSKDEKATRAVMKSLHGEALWAGAPRIKTRRSKSSKSRSSSSNNNSDSIDHMSEHPLLIDSSDDDESYISAGGCAPKVSRGIPLARWSRGDSAATRGDASLQLPFLCKGFARRNLEMQSLIQMLHVNKLVCICAKDHLSAHGTYGRQCGKTQLAIAVARRLAVRSTATAMPGVQYRDGVFFLSLQGVTSVRGVQNAIMKALRSLSNACAQELQIVQNVSSDSDSDSDYEYMNEREYEKYRQCKRQRKRRRSEWEFFVKTLWDTSVLLVLDHCDEVVQSDPKFSNMIKQFATSVFALRVLVTSSLPCCDSADKYNQSGGTVWANFPISKVDVRSKKTKQSHAFRDIFFGESKPQIL